MFRKTTLILLALLILLTLLGAGSLAAQTTTPPDPLPIRLQGVTEVQGQVVNVITDFAKLQVSRNPKLDSVLADLAAAAQVSVEEALDVGKSQLLRLSGDRVHVQIVTHAPGLENAVRAVAKAGGEVTGVGYDDTLIQGWLPVEALETVAAQDDIFYIRRPAELVLLEDLYVGNSTTEGLAVMNGPDWHTAGHTGSGVKVGVIDGGFLGYTSLLGTDLPASVTVKNFVDGENDSQVDGTDVHGTACAEIIHDIAPDATLYLAKTRTNLDLVEAVIWLNDTHQVDIISTSLAWYNLTPGDGTGEFADLVQIARNNGILWTTAASNDRVAHWGGLYSDPDANDVHNFNATEEFNYFVDVNGDPLPISAGYPIRVYVRWDDWTNVDQDYNLYLLSWNGADWDIIASSENVQDGGAGQSPREYVAATTSGSATYYGFAIARASSTRDVNFEIFAPKVAYLNELLHARSLSNLADAPDAMTVAALDVTSPYPQEYYSSEGPTNGPGGAETGGFTKPDISAFANVATESYTGSTFKGTSAATPHVAGAAALVLGANPSYTPDDLQSFLEGRAVDMGSAGKDTQFGYGRLYLGEPVAESTDIYLPLVVSNYDPSELLQNGNFDTGTWTPWITETLPALTDQVYHSASYSARLAGRNNVDSDYVYQEVTVPSDATEVTLDFWYRVSSTDTSLADYMCVEIRDSVSGDVLVSVGCPELYLEPQDQWINLQHVFTGAELTPLLGQTVWVSFQGCTDATNPSTVWLDDVSFKVTGASP
jgi:subtilisin family serine protease